MEHLVQVYNSSKNTGRFQDSKIGSDLGPMANCSCAKINREAKRRFGYLFGVACS